MRSKPAIFGYISLMYSVSFRDVRCEKGMDWKLNDDFIRIYRTEIPWRPEATVEQKSFAFVAWIAVLSVVVTVVAIVCLCYLCWKFLPDYKSRRHSTNTALVGQRPVVAVHPRSHSSGNPRQSRAGRNPAYAQGVINMSFINTDDPHDVPPPYSAVASPRLPNKDSCSKVQVEKNVETPPPAYVTIAPFQ